MEFAYVFECRDGHYFVGRSANPAGELRRHTRTDEHPWTTLHRPVRLLTSKLIDGGDDPLRPLVELWMARVGIDRVRGGPYSELTIPDDEKLALRIRTRALRSGEGGSSSST